LAARGHRVEAVGSAHRGRGRREQLGPRDPVGVSLDHLGRVVSFVIRSPKRHRVEAVGSIVCPVVKDFGTGGDVVALRAIASPGRYWAGS